jgi:pimeloyl-ACP methyl ester carboxylesterase
VRTLRRTGARQLEVRFGSLAGTLTLPPGRGPFPAAVGVHGSGPLDRAHFQVFEALLVAHGVAFLAYDKRGVGQSGGAYPGERATAASLDVLARDAQAAVRFVAARREIDRTRVGLLGDSQAGWIVPLAAAREPAVRWGLLLAGPTVTTGEADLWGGLAGQSRTPPSEPFDRIEADVRAAGPSGFDPAPALRGLSIPVHWIYGSDDRNVPTGLSVEALQRLRAGHEFSWVVLPGMTHALLDLPTGLYDSLPRSRGFFPGLFDAITGWLRGRGLGQ